MQVHQIDNIEIDTADEPVRMVIPRLHNPDADRARRQLHGQQGRESVNAELDIALHIDDHAGAVLQIAHVEGVRVRVPSDEVGRTVHRFVDGYLLLDKHLRSLNPNALFDVDFDVLVDLGLFAGRRCWSRAVLREVEQQPLLRVSVGSRAFVRIFRPGFRHAFREHDRARAGHPALGAGGREFGVE